MPPTRTPKSWGFPRWGEYDAAGFDAATVRICDRHGCEEKGDCPAPKSPNSKDRWYFCQKHAGEYNRGYNYFEGLTKEQAQDRANDENAAAKHARSRAYEWAGSGDGSRGQGELDALELFELDVDAKFEEIKLAYRKWAKLHHPDRKPGDEEAAKLFQAGQAAYEVLKRAEEMREWKGE
ncbi:J domain-containing protein [Pacificimonas sp. WHA3]|uniref:J domain-containing protein n=1 Tax=Pacificimonas pallii TaxID=2827236 RepID=A0ABS6SGV6_9SPHN|nr:J domain-containing protein [Pacificimonas pallii]MBV7257268.1 J domain-containing protein [Pacificimonas pallii]